MHFCMVLQALTEVYPFFFLNRKCPTKLLHTTKTTKDSIQFDLLSETISNKMKKSEHFQWKNRRKWQIFLNKLTHVPPSAICNVSTFFDMKSNDLNWV